MTDAYLRFPHLRGDLITFVAEDDVWLAPVAGGRAWRLSADQVPAGNPRFSSDGSLLAWTSSRDVEPEVHVSDVSGGPSRRLTHWGDINTEVIGWSADGSVLAISSVGQSSVRRTWAYAVSLDGTPPVRLPYGPVGHLDVAADGAVLLGSVLSREPAWWKRYRGGTAGKVWLDRAGTGEFARILSDVDGNIGTPMWVGDRIAFTSDHEGVGAVYSCLRDGSDLRRHCRHEFYARNASTDGHRVIYQCAGELWLLDRLAGDVQPRRLDVRLGGARTGRAPFPLDAAEHLGHVSPDRTGRGSAVEVRGTVHWLTHRDGPARALLAQAGVRARLPQVLGTDQVVWVTDADGEDALEIAPVSGPAPGERPRRIAGGQLSRVLELAASPDGRWVATATPDGRVLLTEVSTGTVREVARAEETDATGLVFAPDSAWLAWSHPGPSPLRNIKLASVADLSTVDVTALRFVDTEPVFTQDGRYLAFLSARSFNPSYDEHVFDVSFFNSSRPYLVPLAADTPSPFAPRLDGRGFDDLDSDDSDDTGQSAGSAPTRIDLDGLDDRVVACPVEAGRYSSLLAYKAGLLWLREPMSGVLGDDLPGLDCGSPRSTVERLDLAKRKLDRFCDHVDELWVSGDGERVVLRDGSDLRVLAADRKADSADDSDEDNEVYVDLDRLRVLVDPGAEWRQSFDEAGRLMRDHFWRADMGGVDWAGVLARYRPLVDAVGSHDDLVDLLWEVHGELGTSHAYVQPPAGDVDGNRRLGLLGADFERDDAGTWRVIRVLPGESSDPRARSPLRAPGVAVRPGDAVVAVDGRPVQPEHGPAALLLGTAGRPVELTVEPAGGGLRRVVVVPLLDDMPLRYHAWVGECRARVHQLSDGRVGYLHVPDMIANGWAQLHRDLRLEMRREALLVDVRENRGGHLSQLVVEKLSRRIVGWQIGRDGQFVESYPADAPRGPVIAVANEYAGSDGDIVNAAIKALGIGPVVGTRTWGGVIGIDMRYRLVDGTLVTQPRYASWMQGYDWGLENHGVDPDVEVVITPQDHAAGRDPQLDTAVRLALDALAERPAARRPDFPPLG